MSDGSSLVPLLAERPLVVGLLLCLLWMLGVGAYRLVWTPFRLGRFYRQQGLRGSPFRPLIGDLLELMRSRERRDDAFVRVFEEGKAKHGPIHFAFLGPEIRLRVFDMAVIKAVLSSQDGVWQKPALMKQVMGRVLGAGLITSEDPVHKLHRRMISPSFSWDRLKAMVPIMSRAADAMIDSVLAQANAAGAAGAGTAAEVDFHHELSTATLAIIGEAAFGSDFDGDDSNAVYSSVNDLLSAAIAHILSGAVFIPFHRYLPFPETLRTNKKIAHLRGLLKRMIAKRRAKRAKKAAAGENNKDDDILLDSLLDARDGEGVQAGEKAVAFSDSEVMDHALTMLIAGHETTSNALTWTMMLLGRHPEWREKARKQVEEVMLKRKGYAGSPPSYDDVQEMPLLQAVIQESMRLYPPVPFILRNAAVDMEVETSVPLRASQNKKDDDAAAAAAGHDAAASSNVLRIARGTAMVIPIAAIHRDPAIWDRPEEFVPDRFINGIAGAMKPGAPSFGFLPFSHGPRNCIGGPFALLEAKVILARMLQRLGDSWELSANYEHHPLPTITLRAGHGMPILIKSQHITTSSTSK